MLTLETGVTITTPTPEYLIEFRYSDDTSKWVMTLQLRPKIFVSNKVIRYIYTAPRSMHLWSWTLMYGDEKVYNEIIDRGVNAGRIFFLWGPGDFCTI